MSHQTFKLTQGYSCEPGAGCAEQLLALLTQGTQWTDTPRCHDKVTANFVQGFNDTLADDNRQRLLPIIPRLANLRIDLESVMVMLEQHEDAYPIQTALEPLRAFFAGAELVRVLGDDKALAWIDFVAPRDIADVDLELMERFCDPVA